MKFKQAIMPGDVGSDVTAVKRTYVRMGIPGAGALAMTPRAGAQFVLVTKTVQRQNNLKADGIYGPQVHAVVSPHFDAYSQMLYTAARVRHPVVPPPPAGDAQALAKKLLAHQANGMYHADNPADLHDLTATADGKPVWSQSGIWVHIDAHPLRLVCWLIEEQKMKVGTYAICSDHSNDGPHGHAAGFAIDMSSLDGIAVAAATARSVTLRAAQLIRGAPSIIRPRQLICGGYGNVRDAEISALSIPAADSFYGSATMAQHCNHIHAGF